MTKEMIPYLLLGFVSVFISCISQTLLKKSSMETHGSILREYLNFPVVFAYFLFFVSTLLTMAALKKVPLSCSPIFESSSYIFITLFGVLFFREKLNRQKIIALLFILLGIVVFSL